MTKLQADRRAKALAYVKAQGCVGTKDCTCRLHVYSHGGNLRREMGI